jgi:hypothetical protein
MIRVLLAADQNAWPRLLAREETVHLGVVPNPLQLPGEIRGPVSAEPADAQER